MRFLVAGYGSIGQRHAAILRAMGHEVVALDPAPDCGADVLTAENLTRPGDFAGALVCTPPDTRVEVVTALNAVVKPYAWFVEKPLGDLVPGSFTHGRIMVGFCYYWLPSLGDFVATLAQHRLAHISIRHGQHLQDYHDSDYRLRYHGTPGRGGVTLDTLPHLLYLARWILGDVAVVGQVKGKLSGLDIQTPDVAAVLVRAPTGQPGLLVADYLRRPRLMEVEAVTGTGDVLRWSLDPEDIPAMYEAQMDAFCAVASGKQAYGYPHLRDGLAVQALLREMRA